MGKKRHEIIMDVKESKPKEKILLSNILTECYYVQVEKPHTLVAP